MRLNPKLASRLFARKSLWAFPLMVLVQLTACSTTKTEDNNTTNTFVKINDLRAADTTLGDEIFSDVCVLDMSTPPVCTVTNDNAEVIMEAQQKDFTQPSGPINDVVFTRYRVTYIRADGRNVPGVDVPYPFDGAANFRVAFDGSESVRAFMVVRLQAKLESPLIEMRNGGGAQVLSVIARIDFFGTDIAGRQIQVTGTLNITFADFADDN